MNWVFVAAMSSWLGFVALAMVATLAMRAQPATHRIECDPAAQMSKLDPPSMDEIRTHVPYIRTVLKSRGVPQRDRGDLVQSVLIGAWEAITSDRYRPDPVRLRAWLAEIARRQAANYRRSARVQWEQLTDPDDMHHESQRTQPDGLLEVAEDWQFVTEQLKSPDEMQSVLIAHDLEELPMAEVARDRRVPLSTAYRWRATALESLRQVVRRRA